ncbi:8-amino-7-oxononanoate synthase [Haloarcula sp. CBA1130]|uniref:aminotransferase class I/II-fold pyridoxal phosphate-dependent enzyme n=1 Tax=unclassified Haloarcula TaxID=2624677 RepID=UPI0012458BEF|nr:MULTISPECIES: 8-amino-7-oxononanoate synthase [unclassified Haloarcula]KAA9397399.1 8-amino-7-oxononanoate synthase [Haloarcula sp. CBA1129]KAA9402567.1 8-amino-7-oxononanoate synthase [Haloarcula sp. CBA1130]
MTHGFALDDRLEQRDAQNLRRQLEVAESVSARTRFADDPNGEPPEFGDEAVVFASNNYLGLADDGRVQRAAELGARTVGTGAGASRLVTGDTRIHRALERDLAASKGTERALVFSSGYAANIGTIDALAPDVVFSDELNHASIIDGCRVGASETVVYDHCDPDDLRTKMESRAVDVDEDEQWLVVTDSVFSMDGDIAPLGAICDVVEQYGAWLMVDEAHATGLFGDSGGGVVQREGLSDRVDVQLGTLSKALASQGGYIAGDEVLIEYLLNAARSFVFSTGLSPPNAAAAREALRIARETDRSAELWDTVATLRDGLETMGYEVLGETQILPVVVGDRGDALELADRLRDHGIVAPAIRPPTVPEGTSRIRVAPMATHTADDIAQCLDAFRTAGREVDVL